MRAPVVPLPAAFLARPIAHRALWGPGRPENSLSAVRAAVEAGYGIEIDVQPSADGAAVVFHDEDLSRLTEAQGSVAARTAADLAALPLRGGTGEGIPSLSAVLAAVAGRVPLLIEIKDQTGRMDETDGLLEDAVARALHGYDGPVAVMSFNPHAVARMAELLPHVPRGLTTSRYDPRDWAPLDPAICDRLRDIPDHDRTGSSFVSHEARDLLRPRLRELRRQGTAILTWTIRSPLQERLARLIADNVTFEGYRA